MKQSIMLFCLLFLFVSCGGANSGSVKKKKYGILTVSELISEKGEALSIVKSDTPNVEFYNYENEEKYQIDKGIVVSSFREPAGDEKTLIYWKHKYSDCAIQVNALSQKSDTHTRPDEEYRCASEGVSLIYNPNIEQVVRVVEYAEAE